MVISHMSIKNLLVGLISWFYYNGHLTALMPVSILLTMMLIHGDQVNLALLGISYLITIIVYSNDRYSGSDTDRKTNSKRSYYLGKTKRYSRYLLAVYLFILAFIVLCFARPELVGLAISIMLLITIGILYTVGLKSFTKYIPAFKNLFIASEWGVATAILYGIFYHTYLSAFTITFGLLVFLKIVNTSIFFDLKDIDSDGPRGLKTLPVLIGYRNTLNLLKILAVVSMVPVIAGVFIFSMPPLTLLLLPFNAIVYGVIKIAESNKGRPSKYYILAHLEYILWSIGILIAMIVINIKTYLL
jgi:4-hydroxybenzoate polyprenyltransferase